MTEILNFLFSEAFLKVLIFSAGFLFAFSLAWNILPDEDQAAIRKRLGVVDDSKRPQNVALFRWFRPFYRLLVPNIASRDIEKHRKKLARQLLTANLQDEITPDEFIGLMIVMSVFMPILTAYLGAAIGFEIPGFAWPLVVVGSFFAPLLWLKERIQARRRALLRAMPYTLDLLTLSVEAGLDFIAAIQRLTQRSEKNALLIEFNQLLKEIRLGTSRSDALRNMSDRLQIEEITSFVTLLIQADQLGASIGPVLRAQSDQLRVSRFQAAEIAGAKASQQVMFPLVICIFPAIFFVALGPVVLNFLQKGFFS